MLTKGQLETDAPRSDLLSRRAAMMIAAGKADKEVSDALGVAPGVLKIWKDSPLFQQLVSTYVEEIEERGLQTIVDDLVSDAPKNIRFVKDVRDGAFDESKERMDLRLRAAKMLLDKQAPNADSRVQNEKAARIILDGRLLGQALRALRNVGAIDITPQAIEKATGEDLVSLVQVKTPEQVAAECFPDEDLDD